MLAKGQIINKIKGCDFFLIYFTHAHKKKKKKNSPPICFLARAIAYFQDKLAFKRNPIHTDCEFILDCVIGQVRREMKREQAVVASALPGFEASAAELAPHDDIPSTNFGWLSFEDKLYFFIIILISVSAAEFSKSGMLAKVNVHPPEGSRALHEMVVLPKPNVWTKFVALCGRSW